MNQPWPTPKPLTPEPQTLPILDLEKVCPKSILWFAEFLAGVGEQLQVRPDLVAPMALSLTSLAATGAYEFRGRPGHGELPPIWTLTVAASGARKSAVLNLLRQPFGRPKDSVAEQGGQKCESPRGQRQREDDGEIDDGDEWKAPARTSATARPLAKAEPQRPAWRDLLSSDASPAGLMAALQENGEQIGIISDEGHQIRQFTTALGGSGIDIFLKGWSGDPVTVRRKRETMNLDCPEIVIGLLVQPTVAAALFRSKGVVERGLPQRLLMASPPGCEAARRYENAVECPLHLRSTWDGRIRELLAVPRGAGFRRRELRLIGEAMERYAKLANRLEGESRNPDHSTFVRQWFGKSHGQALRISGVLSLLGDANATEIGVAEVEAAGYWVEYFWRHAEAVSITSGLDDGVNFHARRVVRWLEPNGEESVARSTITQALRCSDMETVDHWQPVFDLLVDRGYLRPFTNRGSSAGRPSHGFDVNPAIFSSNSQRRNDDPTLE